MSLLSPLAKPLSRPLAFYSFLGAHSLLIGLLPFYLPVFLWGRGFELAEVVLLIAATGAGFVANLGPWQRVATKHSLVRLLWLSFALECLLVFALIHWPLLAQRGVPVVIGALLIGLLSGSYNAWFWTTQRSLFLALTHAANTGRQYGNFQIFVTVFLKLGILIGGWLIDANSTAWILWLSVIVSAGMLCWYHMALPTQALNLHSNESVTLKQSFSYRDQYGSFPIFLLDGLFLFLESHFWLLSLFLVVQQDYSSLGVMVVALAIFFALTFWLLKNTIDAMTGNLVFVAATCLYAVSWGWRAIIDTDSSHLNLLIGLMVITFCSSFFRLAFNKRFFDLARNLNGTHYLLIKSYLSQCILAVFYGILALVLLNMNNNGVSYFPTIYTAAALLSLGYLLYRRP